MKCIGLIGGMSWESTKLYYEIINREVRRRCGGLRSAKLQLVSLDFDEVVAGQKAGDWESLGRLLAKSARGLECMGAECVLIATNTMHRVADEVQAAVSIPLLNIIDVTAEVIANSGLRRLALLGTQFTMEQPFYAERLAGHGIQCVVPDLSERREVHRIIFDELCKGQVSAASRRTLMSIVERQASAAAQGVILGCTELPLILTPSDIALPLFDTTTLHALAAVDFALGVSQDAPIV